MRRVVVTGMGAVTPIGQTVSELFGALLDRCSGVRPVPDSIYSGPASLVAAIADFDPLAHWPPHQAAQLDRATQLGLVAARQAIGDAALDDAEGVHETGVYWGTGLGGAGSIEESYRMLYVGGGRVRPTSVVLAMNNAAVGNIAIAHGLRGPVVNVSTACSSSAVSIGEAFRAIRHGYADVIVAGGSEALITHGNLRAWDAMQALAHADPEHPERSCKPFSANRRGIVLGEGAGALVLESAERAERRGARVYAEIAGYGNACDASHLSRPDVDGQARAMCAALADAKIQPGDVGYVNAHGTATPVGDVVESSAIARVFGDAAPTLPVSSTKALHGHLMGAAGAVEMIVAIAALVRGVAPPTAHLDVPDPRCPLNYVPDEPQSFQGNAVVSNSFAFGGINAVLVARRFTS